MKDKRAKNEIWRILRCLKSGGCIMLVLGCKGKERKRVGFLKGSKAKVVFKCILLTWGMLELYTFVHWVVEMLCKLSCMIKCVAK